MPPPRSPRARLLDLARTERELPAWRAHALEVLRAVVPFERALFHELSPRVPLDRAALVGFDRRSIEAGLGRWDQNAVELGRLRELALVQGGVATDTEAFSPGSRGRAAWNALVTRPLGVRAALLGHLVVHDRIVSVVLLGRRAPFTTAEREAVARLLPALAVGDALLQALASRGLGGVRTHIECVDGRLTPRQREIVVHVAMGHTNEAIGRALGISPNTVRNLLVQVRARLGVGSRAEIVRVAVLR